MSTGIATEPGVGDRYAALLELAGALASTLAEDALHSTIHAHVLRVVPSTAFTVALADPEGSIRTAFHAGLGEGDVSLDPAELSRLRADETVARLRDGQALAVAPLSRGSRLLGWIAARRRDGPAFDGAEAEFLLGVARMAGVAFESARHFAEVRRQSEETERLESLFRELNVTLELQEVVERIAARAHDVIGKPIVVWLLEQDRIRAVAREGGALVRMNEERALPPAALKRLAAGEAAEAMKPEAGRILVPLALGTRVAGFLAVGPWTDHAPDPRALRLLHRMGPHGAAAIENARLHAEVRRLSLTDPLVQLPNRRQLDLFLDKEFAAAARGRPLCMVLYDLDRFKQYNDTRGHRAGDVALIRFADVLRGETRAMNLAARYGGEEFATVLSGTDLEGGRAHAERVRRRVQQVFDGELTVSAGVAEWTPEMTSPIDLVVAADRALYRAKLHGRNRVHVAET